MSNDAILEMKGISKIFIGVHALDNVDLTLRRGKVLALVGENGAGKSTLIKVLTGVHQAERGEIVLEGESVAIRDPKDAFAKGIAVVHQERNLFGTLNVAENIFIEQITNKSLKVVDHLKYIEPAKKWLNMVGLNIHPNDEVSWLSAGQQQLVEIARALSQEAKILILDEPTASISQTEAEMLLEKVRELREQGMSFIFVSHKLEEVFSIADDICVLRDGKNAASFTDVGAYENKAELRSKVITAMIGRDESKKVYEKRDLGDRPLVLEAEGFTSPKRTVPCSFTLKKGEILGWYGLVGSGRTELVREMLGVNPKHSGSIKVNGKPAKIKNPSDAIKKYGITYMSEIRNVEGVFMGQNIIENINVSVMDKSRGGWLNEKERIALADEYIEKLAIKTPSREQNVGNLSGGNRQKVSVAKGLAAKPDIIFIDEPTVGIDIATKEEIYDIVWDLAQQGYSIVFISSDLEEVVAIADRMLIFNNFHICADFENSRSYAEMSHKIMEAVQKDNDKLQDA